MKKVLILTSVRTGLGHKASSNAIEKKLRDAGYDCEQVDVFPLMGKTGAKLEDSYIPVTTRLPFVFFVLERLMTRFPVILHSIMYPGIRRGLTKRVEESRPDLILSVHGMFTRSVSRLIRRRKLDVPFYVAVIDLVDPPSVWQDRDADMTFVPTEAVREQYLKKGFPDEKLIVSGFPVRDDIRVRSVPKEAGDPLNILMLNPSTDLEKNIRFVREVSRLENVRIRFVCGLDERLHSTLLRLKEEGGLPGDVEILGFVSDMQKHLDECEIVLTKAGPNAIIESVRSGTAVVITGHIHGQEDRNHEFILENGYGIRCEDPDRIYEALDGMIRSGELRRCLENTVLHGIGNGAETIAEYVREHVG